GLMPRHRRTYNQRLPTRVAGADGAAARRRGGHRRGGLSAFPSLSHRPTPGACDPRIVARELRYRHREASIASLSILDSAPAAAAAPLAAPRAVGEPRGPRPEGRAVVTATGAAAPGRREAARAAAGFYGRLPEEVRRCLRPLNLVEECASFMP